MGCDIHMHIELKINNVWEHYACPKVKRWYDLFGLLANVRNEVIEPISKVKGLPNDISIITSLDYKQMKGDAHSESYLNADEILKLSETLRKWETRDNVGFLAYDLENEILNTYLFGNSFAWHKKYDDCHLPENVEDVRFVFWFDN